MMSILKMVKFRGQSAANILSEGGQDGLGPSTPSTREQAGSSGSGGESGNNGVINAWKVRSSALFGSVAILGGPADTKAM